MNEFETNVLKKRPSETESVRFSRICAPVTDELELKLLGWMYYTNQIDTNELLKTFKIDRKKAYKLKQKHIDGSKYSTKKGRLPKFTQKDAKAFDEMARNAHETSRAINHGNFLKLMDEHAVRNSGTEACDKTKLNFLKKKMVFILV